MIKILAIEDEPAILENVIETLEAGNYEVVGAENGAAGLELAQQVLPDLIVSDIMMPDMNGYDVLVALRGDPATARIPFIFLSAVAERSSVREGMNLGADDYLTKPFTATELLTAVSARLEKHSQAEQDHEHRMTELRENLLHMLPHELRTPLNAVLGYSEMLMGEAETLSPAEVADFAMRINQGGARLLKLIERFLNYAQIEVIRNNPLWIDRLREEIVESPASVISDLALAYAAKAKRESDLRLELVEVPGIHISPEFFQLLFTELLDNAFRFSKANTPVTINAQPLDGQYQISIRNEGRGMTAHQISQIGAYMQFQRQQFEQQGVGLGLAIAKGFAELYSGELSIESAPDQYLVVCVMLPLASS